MSLYKGCRTAVSVDWELSSSFSVKVCVQQGSALSPLLFIMVMDFLTEDVRNGSLTELLYADDLVLCGESLNEVMEKYGRWENAVERKGLRENVDKTKGMQLLFGQKVVFRWWILVVPVVSGLFVILFRVRNVRGGFMVVVLMCLGRCVYYHVRMSVCRTYLGHNCSVEKLEFKSGEDVLEEVEKFCYLGDKISCNGGASEVVSVRISSAWEKFRELSGVLVGKQGLSLKQRRKIYQCCARRALLCCCETWELTVADEVRLHRVERRMIRMMCGVRLVDRVSTDALRDNVGFVVKIEDII